MNLKTKLAMSAAFAASFLVSAPVVAQAEVTAASLEIYAEPPPEMAIAPYVDRAEIGDASVNFIDDTMMTLELYLITGADLRERLEAHAEIGALNPAWIGRYRETLSVIDTDLHTLDREVDARLARGEADLGVSISASDAAAVRADLEAINLWLEDLQLQLEDEYFEIDSLTYGVRGSDASS